MQYYRPYVVDNGALVVVIVADVDVKEDVGEEDYDQISKDLNVRVKEDIENIAYCFFYITPKFSY